MLKRMEKILKAMARGAEQVGIAVGSYFLVLTALVVGLSLIVGSVALGAVLMGVLIAAMCLGGALYSRREAREKQAAFNADLVRLNAEGRAYVKSLYADARIERRRLKARRSQEAA